MSNMLNHYQKRAVASHEVVTRIKIADPQQVSRIILSVSPCRSGSTVLLRVFGATGIVAHFQEIKNILRWRMQGGEYQWRIPQRVTEQTLFLKETLGPYTMAESTLNPLKMLLDAGMPAHKIHLLLLGRSPLNSWASWRSWWAHKTTVQHFIMAYKTTAEVGQLARHHHIATTTLVYEAIRDNEPTTVIQKLFAQLGLPFKPQSVAGWRVLPPFGSHGSNIRLPEEPPAFDVAHIHGQPIRADRLIYTSREANILHLPPASISSITETDIPALYDQWRQQCERDLSLTIAPDTHWTGYH